MSIWTAIGGLAGTLLNRKDKKEDRARQDRQLQTMVADAKAAGISPLAALGSNVAGNYGQPVGSSSGQMVSDAISGAGKAYAGRAQKKLQLENMALQNDLVRAEIEALNSETVARATSRSRVGSEASGNEAIQTHLYVYDPRKGKYGWRLNPALAMDPNEALATQMWYGSEYADPKTPSLPSDRRASPSLPNTPPVGKKQLRYGRFSTY